MVYHLWTVLVKVFKFIVVNTAAIIISMFLLALFTLICLFIWGFTSLSTLYRSYHDG